VKPKIPAVEDWISEVSGRLTALPDQANLVQFARLGTALTVGAELIRLRSLAFQFRFASEFDPAFRAIAHGQSQAAIEFLAKADGVLGQTRNNVAPEDICIGARASILLLVGALSRHGAYFDGRALE
jgi:hypothetical protein